MAHETVIPVLYRDAANYKATGQIVLIGTLTPDQIATLRSALDEGEYYNPMQLDHLHMGELKWPERFPGEDDHSFQEMLLDEIVTGDAGSVPHYNTYSVDGGPVDQFVAQVTSIGSNGWVADPRFG
jgi:hypothetical protein